MIGTSLDHNWASSLSIFQRISRLSAFFDLKWIHARPKTLLRWGPQLKNPEARRLGNYPNGFLGSRHKYWQLTRNISQNISQPWHYGLVCVSGGYDNLWYNGDGVVQSSGMLLTTWLIDICWSSLHVLFLRLVSNDYSSQFGIALRVWEKYPKIAFFGTLSRTSRVAS